MAWWLWLALGIAIGWTLRHRYRDDAQADRMVRGPVPITPYRPRQPLAQERRELDLRELRERRIRLAEASEERHGEQST